MDQLNVLFFNAIKKRDIEDIKLLIKEGGDVNAIVNDWPLLMLASRFSGLETVKLLLESGADVNILDDTGYTSLMMASKYSNESSSLDTVKLLLESGADVNIQEYAGAKFTALMVASKHSNKTSSLETVRLLLAYGATIDNKSRKGFTALMLASKYSNTTNSLETVETLLENGANPFIRNNMGETALDLCPTDQCKALISKNMWDRMYQNVKLLSRQYSRSGTARFPKDIWELILLRSKQQQLCKRLSNEKNKYILVNFALLLDIPVSEDMSKRTLCDLVSKQLGYGGKYSQKSREYFRNKAAVLRLGATAKMLGVNTSQTIDKILDDISSVLTK